MIQKKTDHLKEETIQQVALCKQKMKYSINHHFKQAIHVTMFTSGINTHKCTTKAVGDTVCWC